MSERDLPGIARGFLPTGYNAEAITAHERDQELQGHILQLKRERETALLHLNAATAAEKNTQIDALEAELLALRQQMGWA